MSNTHSESPIEDYLDELLSRLHADPRSTRRLLDEASDHLSAVAGELEASGSTRVDAEREAVRRFGSAAELTRGARRRSAAALVMETSWAALLLGGCGLVAVGVSGVVVAAMNLLFGSGFVGGTTVWGTGGSPINETVRDAVVLRGLAGLVGVAVLAGLAVLRRYVQPTSVLPAGLVDALGAAAFAAATVVLVGASLDQALTGPGGHGVGFFLSGALVSLIATLLFSARSARALLRWSRPAAGGRAQAEPAG